MTATASFLLDVGMNLLRNFAVAGLATSTLLTAQLPDWVTLQTSSTPTMLWAESSIVVVQDTAGFHLYSSYTRVWSHLQTSANASFYGYDDHVVIVDGTQAWGYATRAARIEPLTLNAPPLVPSPSRGAVWLTALIDGNDAHLFSGLLGTWTTVRFHSSPLGSIGRMAGVFTDGTRTVGYSAHFGEAVDLGMPNVGMPDAIGYCATVRDADYFHVFGAYRNRWRSVPASSSAALVKPPSRAGYVVVQEPEHMTFFSALTDSTTSLYHGSNQVTLSTEANVATVQDGNRLFAYSCATGTLDTVTSPNGWNTIHLKQETVVAEDGTDVHAFGVRAGRFAPAVTGQLLGAETGTALAIETATGSYQAFSCLTNAWSAAPAGNYPIQYVTYNGVILADGSGTMHGFSANRGTWTTQVAPMADSYYQHKAAFCARSGNRLDSFNGRTGEWATVTTNAPANVTCFDMSVVALDGTQMHCISCYKDEWSTETVATTSHEIRDECAWGFDGSTVHVWSGSSQVSEWANMPEYWRILARGGKLHYDVGAEPGAQAILAIGGMLTDTVTPYGRLRVDLSSAALVPVAIPAQGTGSLSLIVPDLVSLRGVTLFAQGIFVSPSSTIYLSDYFESTIL